MSRVGVPSADKWRCPVCTQVNSMGTEDCCPRCKEPVDEERKRKLQLKRRAPGAPSCAASSSSSKTMKATTGAGAGTGATGAKSGSQQAPGGKRRGTQVPKRDAITSKPQAAAAAATSTMRKHSTHTVASKAAAAAAVHQGRTAAGSAGIAANSRSRASGVGRSAPGGGGVGHATSATASSKTASTRNSNRVGTKAGVAGGRGTSGGGGGKRSSTTTMPQKHPSRRPGGGGGIAGGGGHGPPKHSSIGVASGGTGASTKARAAAVGGTGAHTRAAAAPRRTTKPSKWTQQQKQRSEKHLGYKSNRSNIAKMVTSKLNHDTAAYRGKFEQPENKRGSNIATIADLTSKQGFQTSVSRKTKKGGNPHDKRIVTPPKKRGADDKGRSSVIARLQQACSGQIMGSLKHTGKVQEISIKDVGGKKSKIAF